MRRVLLIGGIVVVVAVVVVLGVRSYLADRGEGDVEGTPTPAPSPVPSPTPVPTPSWMEGVTLSDSDDVVREQAADLSGSSAWERWLGRGDLVRRFVASVNLIAQGKSPRNQVEFLRPQEPFEVVERGGDVFPDPNSFRRYDRVVDVMVGTDPAMVVELYREARPLVDAAYAEISRPGSSFDPLLGRAIDHLLDTPVPDGPTPLEPKVVTYTYQDDRLEGLSDAQRQLLRLGPENAGKVKSWLREIRSELTRAPEESVSEPAVETTE